MDAASRVRFRVRVSRTFAMLYVLWTGDALAAALTATACTAHGACRWCTRVCMAQDMGRRIYDVLHSVAKKTRTGGVVLPGVAAEGG
eukprot:scaffold133307_cov84-Phaeocystis_antarctica.AAC.1